MFARGTNITLFYSFLKSWSVVLERYCYCVRNVSSNNSSIFLPVSVNRCHIRGFIIFLFLPLQLCCFLGTVSGALGAVFWGEDFIVGFAVLSLNWSFPGVTYQCHRSAFLGASCPGWPLKRASKVHTLPGEFSHLPLHTHTEFGSRFPSGCIEIFLNTQIWVCFA